MSRSRRLTEAEIEIWLKVARTVVPRAEASLPSAAPPVAQPLPKPTLPPKPVLAPARLPTAANYSPPMSQPGGLPLTGFERRYKKKVAGGRVNIDGVLDLHGMTQAEAHGALERFLFRTQAGGGRLVLVVTGKGGLNRGRSPDGDPGVLRRVVPHWLRDRSLRGVVLGFEEAARGHGGTGALYVRLRRGTGGD